MAHTKTFVSLIISIVFFPNSHFSNAEINPTLQEFLDEFGSSDVLVQFFGENSPVIDDIESRSFSSYDEKVKVLISDLKSLASKTQDPITSVLQVLNVESESLWISNQMVIRNVPLSVVEFVDTFPQVWQIHKLPIFQLSLPIQDSEVVESSTVNEKSWGVDKIKADKVHANSVTGKKVVVANIDTGVRWTHEALKRTWLKGGWYDPYGNSKLPQDDHGHGTHVMGTMVGHVGRIGVAPEAHWIAAKGCTKDGCNLDNLVKCGQWMLGGRKGTPKRPDIINNSWGGLPVVDFMNNFYGPTVKSWRAAGILPVFANGNAGPFCATVSNPAHLSTVFGVGATTEDDTLADFSSRGPGLDNIEKIKPDISAPGVKIRSAWIDSDTSYNTISGTSMASPHFAGVLALMLSAKRKDTNDRSLTFEFDNIKSALAKMVDNTNLKPPIAILRCPPSLVLDYQYPNNEYGWGLISAPKAVRVARHVLSPVFKPPGTINNNNNNNNEPDSLIKIEIG